MPSNSAASDDGNFGGDMLRGSSRRSWIHNPSNIIRP
jgi:hypothetical protein